jgi:hypothetical protein
MGAKAYTRAQMAEAVALGAIIGAEAAAERLGMGAGAIRSWMARAEYRPVPLRRLRGPEVLG